MLDLDGRRDDGDPALGEADLLQSIESLSGGSGNDIITGDDGINDLDGRDGSDRIDGRGGFDQLAGDFFGSDTGGNDTIFARDGLADTIDCADGVDLAITDDVDITFECENRQSIPDLQPDRDGDGIDKPLDCNDLAGTVRPGAFDRPGDGVDQDCDGADAIDTDRDRDGFHSPASTATTAAARFTPARCEMLGNRIDEDCDKVADPFAAFPDGRPALGAARRRHPGRRPRARRPRRAASASGSPARARAASSSRAARKAGRRADSLILDKQVRGARLRPGARLIVRVTRARPRAQDVHVHDARQAGRRSRGSGATRRAAARWRDAETRALVATVLTLAVAATPAFADSVTRNAAGVIAVDARTSGNIDMSSTGANIVFENAFGSFTTSDPCFDRPAATSLAPWPRLTRIDAVASPEGDSLLVSNVPVLVVWQGGGGTDVANILGASPTHRLELHAGDGDDFIAGGAAADLIDGGPGSDRLTFRPATR